YQFFVTSPGFGVYVRTGVAFVSSAFLRCSDGRAATDGQCCSSLSTALENRRVGGTGERTRDRATPLRVPGAGPAGKGPPVAADRETRHVPSRRLTGTGRRRPPRPVLASRRRSRPPAPGGSGRRTG